MPAKKTKTLVRAADGTLFLVSKNELPQQLDAAQTATLNQILVNTETKLSTDIQTAIPALGSGVHLAITEVFPTS